MRCRRWNSVGQVLWAIVITLSVVRSSSLFAQAPTLRAPLRGHENSIQSVAFSPDGRTLASASADGTIRLWDVGTGKTVQNFKGHGGAVCCVVFSPDGALL